MLPGIATSENPFAALGVTALQQSIYTTLLYHPGSTLSELAVLAEQPRSRLAGTLMDLEALGMVDVDVSPDPAYFPFPPDADEQCRVDE